MLANFPNQNIPENLGTVFGVTLHPLQQTKTISQTADLGPHKEKYIPMHLRKSLNFNNQKS